MEEEKLVRLLKKNPSKGIYELIAQYQGYVHTIIANILGDHQEDIEECASDTFMKVWKNIDKFEGKKGTLKGYIATIARNEAINCYHKLQRQKVVYLDEKLLPDGEDVLLEIVKKEEQEKVEALILAMEEPDRSIMIRKYYFLESMKTIAKYLHIDEKQVENRLYRTRKKLKELLIREERRSCNE